MWPSPLASSRPRSQVEGKQLKIQKAAMGKGTGGPSGPVTLYLAGFNPATFGMNELQQLLAPYGAVVSVKVHPSQPGKKGEPPHSHTCIRSHPATPLFPR